ncbi:MAG: O-antigen ligase family protein [Bacteroidetes bacterium]|jgi:hypothetical protein|nr:O-antigen ligase family protein [Bacteroidota bacterium]
MKKNNKIFFTDYLLVFLLLATTGIEYFYRSQNYIVVSTLIAIFIFLKSKKKLNINSLLIILLFAIVETFQFLLFGGFNLRTPLGTMTRLLLAYLVIELTRFKFLTVYVNLIYFLSLISFIFYFCSFIPGFFNFFYNTSPNILPQLFSGEEGFYKESPNIIIYNFHQASFNMGRNPGPFWEPGAFAVFISLALILNSIKRQKLLKGKNLIFLIALITTFSTTGYMCLFVFIIYSNIDALKKNALYSILLLIVASFSIIMYEKIPFLKEKIEKDVELKNETTSSRFGSALADIKDFARSPVFGLGRAGAKNNFIDVDNFDSENHRNNGFFNLLATYGVLITLFYMYKIYESFKIIGNTFQLPTYFKAVSFIILMLLGLSQGIYMRPFFYSFMFIPIVFSALLKNKNEISNSNSNV